MDLLISSNILFSPNLIVFLYILEKSFLWLLKQNKRHPCSEKDNQMIRKFQTISAETVSSTDDDSKSDDMAEYYKSPPSSFPYIRSGSSGRFIWYFGIPAQTYSHLTLCLSGQFIWNMSATFFDPTIHSLFFWWKCSAFQHYLNCVLGNFHILVSSFEMTKQSEKRRPISPQNDSWKNGRW